MQTFSSRLSALRPESLFSFSNGMTTLEFKDDLNQSDVIDRPATWVGSDHSEDNFIAHWVKPSMKFNNIDTQYLSNQLSENEVFSQIDSSLVTGRTSTLFSGYYYKLARSMHHNQGDHDKEIKDRLTKNEPVLYFWQMNFSKDDTTALYTQFDYDDPESDDYAVIMRDIDHPEKSYSIVQTFNSTKYGKEVWTGTFNPENLDDGSIINKDMRYIAIELVELRTGIVFDSCKWLYSRAATMQDGVQGTIIRPVVTNKFNEVYDIFTPINFEPTSQNPKIEKVVFNNTYDLFLNSPLDPAIPSGQMAITVNVPKGRYRSIKRDDNAFAKVRTHVLMQWLHFKLVYDNETGRINLDDIIAGTPVYSFNAPRDTTMLFGVQINYVPRPGNNFVSRAYDYDINYQFKIGFNREVKSFEYTTRFTGNVTQSDRSTGNTKYILGPCDMNMPVTVGQMSGTDGIVARSKHKYEYERNKFIDIETIDYCRYMMNPSYCYIDNYARLENLKLELFDDLHYRMYFQSNIIIDQFVTNYWACDDFHEQWLTTKMLNNNSGAAAIIKNTKAAVLGTYYNGFSDMYVTGNGKVKASKVTHRIVKRCIDFDNMVGAVKTQNLWNEQGFYTINFWFKSDQKTEGIIISDFDKETADIGNGIMIGIKEGYLNVQYSQLSEYQYKSKLVCDGEWHMITVVHGLKRPVDDINTNFLPTVSVYIDGKVQDKYLYNTTNSISFTKRQLALNYDVYFMGHPLYNNVKGSLSRVGFYKYSFIPVDVQRLFTGDLEFAIKGTILSRNTPVKTTVRFYNEINGTFAGEVESDQATGNFLFRTYDNSNLFVTVLGLKTEAGYMQSVGPVAPVSLEDTK